MCGRYTLTVPGAELAELFDLERAPELTPRYNIAPTQEVAAVRLDPDAGERRLDMLHWGLIPFWAKDPSIGNRMINARGETVAEKPAFRNSFKRQRCLVAADGFYEWKKTGGGKQPYYIHMAGGGPFAFAGLWSHWDKGEEGPIDSCTLITTEPNELLADIHDRMPVILAPGDFDLWLDSEAGDRERLEALLEPYPAAEMRAYPVSRHVNKPGNDDPRCVEPLAGG